MVPCSEKPREHHRLGDSMTFADKMRQLFHPEERWPHWAIHLYRKLDHLMAITDDIRAAVDNVHTILSEVNLFATQSQLRLDSLTAQVEELTSEITAGNVDPVVVEELKTSIAELRAKADALVAIVPAPVEEVPAETPAEAPVAEAPAE